jgi:tetratricopeptide (TPR) repeat protein
MLDGLPLALATAGAYLGQVSTSLEEYVRYYNKSWLKLQKTSPELLSYKGRTLYSTWNPSFEHIKSQNESAAQLLRLWAYFDNHDVWYELLAAGKNRGPAWFSDIVEDELSFNQVIRLLCDHGLVESFEAPGQLSKGYAMHSCVHNWTKYVLGDEDDIEMEKLVFSCVGSSVPTKQDPNYQAIQRRLLPHANKRLGLLKSNIDVSFENYQEYHDDISSLGALFADQGMLNEAEFMYERALEGYGKALGLEQYSTLATVHNLGTVYKGQSKLDKAKAMYQRALDGKEKSLGPDHPSTLETAEKLGTLYSD